MSAKYNAWMVANGHTSLWMAAKTKLLELRQKAAALATKVWTGIQKAWSAVMRGGRWLLDTGRLIAHKIATLAASAATKVWTAAQWLWTKAMTVGGKLLSVGKLIAYKVASIAIAVASKAWAAAQWLLNAAMNANPIGLVVAAIGFLIAAFVIAYNKCEWFREKVDSAWETMKTGAEAWKNKLLAAVQWVTDKWEALKNSFGNTAAFIGEKWDEMKGWFAEKLSFSWDWLTSGLSGIWQTVKNAFISGGEIFGGITEGILSTFKSIVNSLIRGINTVVAIPFDGINSALAGIRDISIFGLSPFTFLPVIPVPQIPELAKGGIFTRPQLAIFAENGPEAAIPFNSGGESIWRATGEMAGFSTGGEISFSPSFNLTVNAGSGADGDAIGRRIIREIEAELPRMLKRFNEQQTRVAYS
ncbi:MAG: hypothetical protein LBS53_14535 [Synergistaceae bacterium]|nr:hypothetical protein [Synergistaceae bacterium]